MSQACRLLSQIHLKDKLRQESQRRRERRQREVAAANLGYRQQQPAVENSKSDFDNNAYTVKRIEHDNDEETSGRYEKEKQSGSASRVTNPQSTWARSATGSISRQVNLPKGHSEQVVHGYSSSTSSVCVSQSPIKPNNSARHNKLDKPTSNLDSIDDKIEKREREFGSNARVTKEIQDSIDFKNSPPLCATEAPLHDDDDDDADGKAKFAKYALDLIEQEQRREEEKLRAPAQMREKEAIQLIEQANALEICSREPETNEATMQSKDFNHVPVPQKEDEDNVKTEQATQSTGCIDHSSEVGAVHEVRRISGKDLWDDSDEDEVALKSSPKTAEERKGRGKRGRRDEERRRSLLCAKEDQERLEENQEDLAQQLKPVFTSPKFGPFEDELDQIVLPRSEEEYDQVPNSIVRYLPPYQKFGIEFLHAALFAGSGAILGDDMGLGKTVQIIGLLSALLRKKGNGLDLFELQCRRRNVAKAKEEYKLEKLNALMNGSHLPDESELAKCQNLPSWAPILLVVPTAVFQNWLNEFNVWGYFGVAAYSGPKREEKIEDIKTGAAEILLCGVTFFRQEFAILKEVDWKLIIIDEFHSFKNPDGKASRNLRILRKSNKKLCVIGVTGTLMQNDHKELWNLIDLVMPDFLGTRAHFEAEVALPIKMARTKTANDAAVAFGDKKAELAEKMRPFYLHRPKDILNLPKKEELVVFCELSPLQNRIYQHMLMLPDFALLKRANAPCDCGVNQEFFIAYKKLRTTKERLEYQRKHKDRISLMKTCCYSTPIKRDRYGNSEIDPRAVLWRYHDGHEGGRECSKCPYCILFPAIQKLLKVASHAALLQLDRPLKNYTPGTSDYRAAEKDFEFAKVAIPSEDLVHFPGGSYVCEESIMDNHFMLSGKMKMLDEVLRKQSAAGNRVLIFTPFTKTLDLIQNYIKANGYTFLRMDGSIPQPKRQPLIFKFQNDPNIFIFLLSTKATGVGITLTAANVVIIFDCDWNPSTDAQAQDRAYRIGQEKDVQVIRLVSRGTIDELKYIRQIYKEQLKMATIGDADESAPRVFRGVQGDSTRKGELFGCENLLKFKDGSFMADLWKANDVTTSEEPGTVALHPEGTFVDVLGKTDLHKIIGLENDEFQSFELVANQGSKVGRGDLAPAILARDSHEVEEEDEELSMQAKAVHHGDFFRGDRGGAALKPGDDGYDEEMGGESQMMYDVLEHAGVDTFEEPESEAILTQVAVSRSVTSMQSPIEINETVIQPKFEDMENCIQNLARNGAASVLEVTPSNQSPPRPKITATPPKSVVGSERKDTALSTTVHPSRSVPHEKAKLESPTATKSHRDRVFARLQSSKRQSTLHQLDLPTYIQKTKKTKRK